mmetsp:Transcript_33708/g.46667  ORF Transcript_33708/g.46667 Transcript_33708/m.46667 type:complete len:100 (-) Transcript_33708:359-658(-)|eukprot:CAMPEP_0196578782 /NCGR_PEP_ID=MMETSP1081-20130531/7618_1 /TAXON_ID=36882 /ORGANISM="Pyramimonas amylifera, Strain CCMP720" /LENGTH=99 /DNA_ID=CAMNT_0041898103 /DNA_START=167 /DNA_END=466 /DNA_ORIENTATION=-
MAQKTDEEYARELQAQFDAEIAEVSNPQDEELAKKLQEELELEEQFNDANRQFQAEKDEKAALKAQQEEDFASGRLKRPLTANSAVRPSGFSSLPDESS